jgi:hypothetical protein
MAKKRKSKTKKKAETVVIEDQIDQGVEQGGCQIQKNHENLEGTNATDMDVLSTVMSEEGTVQDGTQDGLEDDDADEKQEIREIQDQSTNGDTKYDKDEHSETTTEIKDDELDLQTDHEHGEHAQITMDEPHEEVLEEPHQDEDQFDIPQSSETQESRDLELRVPNTLISSSSGPFTLSQLEIEFSHSLGVPTYITHHQNNLFIGTSWGNLLHYKRLAQTQEFILVSQRSFHSMRQFPITKILPLPTLQILLVLSGHLLQCFNIIDLTPLAIGRIKDVYDIILDWDHLAKCDENGVHVVVLTKQQIRVVNVTKQALRLVKDIKTVGYIGSRRGDKLMIANKQYMIVDISKEFNNQNSLFPVNTSSLDDTFSLRPFIQNVGKNEFLLVCGTAEHDPAMGLIVNTKGDVSRGTIPMMQYPDDVIVDDDFAFVLIGNEIDLYSLDDQMELQSWKFEHKVQLAQIDEIEVPMESLRDIIVLKSINGADLKRDEKELEFATKVSQVASGTVCYCEDFVQLLVPQARLEKINHLRDVKLLERELSKSRATSEITVIEVEYLNLQISLLRLLTHQYDLALDSWTNGTLDPRILIYAFNFTVYGQVYIFQGLHILFQQLKALIKETALLTFFELFLERWLSKESLDDHDTIISLEETALEYHLNYDSRQLAMILPRLRNIDVIPKLEEEGKYLALAGLYGEEDARKAVKIHQKLIDGEIVDQNFNRDESLHIICELSKGCPEQFRKDVGIWLLSHDAKLGISFMNSSKISLKSLDMGMGKKEELRHVMDSIDDVSLRYEYAAQMFVGLRREKMRLSMQKGMYRSLLKRLQDGSSKMGIVE